MGRLILSKCKPSWFYWRLPNSSVCVSCCAEQPLAVFHIWEVPNEHGWHCPDGALPSQSPKAPRSGFAAWAGPYLLLRLFLGCSAWQRPFEESWCYNGAPEVNAGPGPPGVGKAGPKLHLSPGRWAQPRELGSLSPGGPCMSFAWLLFFTTSWWLIAQIGHQGPLESAIPQVETVAVSGVSNWLPGWPSAPGHSLWNPARAGEEWAWRWGCVCVCLPTIRWEEQSVGRVGHSGRLLLSGHQLLCRAAAGRWFPAPSIAVWGYGCCQHTSLYPSHRSAGATSQISSHAEYLPCLSYGQSTLLFQLLICFHCHTNFRAVTLSSSWLTDPLQHLICSSRTDACPGARFGRSVTSLLIL